MSRQLSMWWVVALCAAPLAGLSACGDDVELVKPTPSSAFASTYPCQLLTKAMAQDLLALPGLRRIGQQSSADGLEACTWARGRYKQIPQVSLTLSPRRSIVGKSVAAAKQVYERGYDESGRPWPGYRALKGLGDHAFLVSAGRDLNEVQVEQDGRSFDLIMRLKQHPRSQRPPLKALEAAARDISARFVRPPG